MIPLTPQERAEGVVPTCCKCDRFGEVRYSLGIYAGRYCNEHWKTSGYRDEPASAFDPMDAGETYDEED